MLSPGVVLNGRYQLTQRIAAGGMGEVWRGDDLLLHRAIAVKVLLPALMSDSDFITRFRSEARMMAALRHPGIVQVYDYGENAQVGAHRLDYLVMEYIDGTPLSQRIQQAGRLGPAETMTVVAQVADALQVAHEAGIIHRDVKPSNLLVRPAGAIVLVDFGVARSLGVTGITSTNVVLGSAHYMAPEQAEGQPVTAATDVYALGAVAFSCLTGHPPYVGDNPLAVLTQLVHGQPPVLPPDVPAPAASVVLRALAKNPGHRFPSASAFAAAARSAQQPSSYGVSAPHPRQAGSAAAGPARAMSPGPGRTGAFGPTASRGAGGAFGPAASPGASGAFGRAGSAPGGTGAFGRAGSAPGGTGGFGPAGSAPGGTGAHGFTPGAASVGASRPGYASAFTTGGTDVHGLPPAGAAVRGAASGFGTAGRAGTAAGDATSPPSSGKRRNTTVALAAAAVVTVLAGIGVILGTLDDDTGTGSLSQDPLTDEPQAGADRSAGPGGRPSARPNGQKPTPGKSARSSGGRTTAPTKPAGAVTTAASSPATTATNPHSDPVALCGGGYEVVDSKALTTSAGVLRGTIYVLRQASGGANCVVTIKAATLDESTSMSATLQVQGDEKTYAKKGTFQYYAGPVTAPAAEACIKWGGAIGGMSYESGWTNCD